MVIDDLDFRAWLLKHEPIDASSRSSSIVRMVYDTAFLYQDGDPARPNGAAGAVLGGSLRWQPQGSDALALAGGMGECVIAPLYETLLRAGVEFQFFHKCGSAVDLSADGKAIGAIRIARQADVLEVMSPDLRAERHDVLAVGTWIRSS